MISHEILKLIIFDNFSDTKILITVKKTSKSQVNVM